MEGGSERASKGCAHERASKGQREGRGEGGNWSGRGTINNHANLAVPSWRKMTHL